MSFFTVFRCVVGQDCTQVDGKPIFLLLATSEGWGYGILYCVAMILFTIGLLNVILAIFVENTLDAARYNGLVLKRQRLRDEAMVSAKVEELVLLICSVK